MSASQSGVSAACLVLPFRKPLEKESDTPLVKWSTSMSTSLEEEGPVSTLTDPRADKLVS